MVQGTQLWSSTRVKTVIEPSVRAFLNKWGSIPGAAINYALRATFPDLQRLSPPIDLRYLAELRNVGSIKTLEMPVDGTISFSEGRYLIELNRAHSKARRRFTCGHEIGHTFFLEKIGRAHV